MEVSTIERSVLYFEGDYPPKEMKEDYSNISDEGLRLYAVTHIANGAIKPGPAIADQESLGLTSYVVPSYLREAHPVFHYQGKQTVWKKLNDGLMTYFSDKQVSEIRPTEKPSAKLINAGNYQISQSFSIDINGVPHRIDVLNFETNSNVTNFHENAIRRPFGGTWVNKHVPEDLFPNESRQIVMLDLFEGESTLKVFDKSSYQAFIAPNKNKDNSGHELHPVVIISIGDN